LRAITRRARILGIDRAASRDAVAVVLADETFTRAAEAIATESGALPPADAAAVGAARRDILITAARCPLRHDQIRTGLESAGAVTLRERRAAIRTHRRWGSARSGGRGNRQLPAYRAGGCDRDLAVTRNRGAHVCGRIAPDGVVGALTQNLAAVRAEMLLKLRRFKRRRRRS
jgi:hypothetical protein